MPLEDYPQWGDEPFVEKLSELFENSPILLSPILLPLSILAKFTDKLNESP